MERRYRITVDGHPYTVTVEELGEERPHLPSPGAVSSVVSSATSALVSQSAAPTAGAVVSSLGGIVDRISVAVGDCVAVGDTLLTIDAMKMKNAIVAPSAGTVLSISVSVGETVDSGQILMTLG